MKLYYWSPFFSNVATEKAVINSVKSFNKFSKKKINPYLLDVIGEWKDKNRIPSNLNINIKDLLKFKLIKYLPRFGFLKSRFSYILVFLFSVFKLHRFLKNEKPDYLVVHLMTFIPLSLLLFFKYETKFILRISGYPKLHLIRAFFWKIIGKKLFLVTTPTKLTGSLLRDSKIFDSDKIKYLPDPILDINEIKNKKIINNTIEKEISSRNTLLSIGRLTKQKNFNFLINAFIEILKDYSNLNLVILGDGEEKKKLKNLIKKNNLEKKIFLFGYRENIYSYLKNSKMFILTSRWEDPGFVLIEAAYMNKTVLSSDCPNGPKEILDNEKNGFLFESNSTASFLKKFDEIQNSEKSVLLKKKISFKKKIKEFTLVNHFNVFSNLLIDYEN